MYHLAVLIEILVAFTPMLEIEIEIEIDIRFFLTFKRRYLDNRTSEHSIPCNFLKQFFEFFIVVSTIYLFRVLNLFFGL